MNRFVMVEGLPYLLHNGKTYGVRWTEEGFTVGEEVKLPFIPERTHSEDAIKAKCGQYPCSLGQAIKKANAQAEKEKAEKPGDETPHSRRRGERHDTDGRTAAGAAAKRGNRRGA